MSLDVSFSTTKPLDSGLEPETMSAELKSSALAETPELREAGALANKAGLSDIAADLATDAILIAGAVAGLKRVFDWIYAPPSE